MQARTLLLLSSTLVTSACFDPMVVPSLSEETDADTMSDGPPDTPVGSTTSASATNEATSDEPTSTASDGTGLDDETGGGPALSTSGSTDTGGCPTAVFGAAAFDEACFG